MLGAGGQIASGDSLRAVLGSSGQNGLRWPLEIPFELKCARAVCQKGSPLGNGSKLTHSDSCQMQMTPQAWHCRWQRLLHVILLGWHHGGVLCNLILFFTGFVDPSRFTGNLHSVAVLGEAWQAEFVAICLGYPLALQ